MVAGGDDERARFQAAMALVDRVLDLPAGERDAVLARDCDDDALRAEVRELLAADARDDDRLAEPAGTNLPSAMRALTRVTRTGAEAGHRVGPFRLLALLGKGGMGEVWTAERVGADFEQKVAVKLLYRGGDGEAGVARFRRERQILATLSHPRIARLLDGGVTEDGQPWLAMELVVGLPLTTHCDDAKLDVPARLRLFAEVCEAVQFAHQNLVVHRDLKPSNILVDAHGAPRLLDFGIAKLIDDDESATALTAAGERPMTPDYASPEQVRGETITTASDVWTLGAILHELLTGARVDPALAGTTKGRPSAVAREPAARARLRGDLDAIVLMAMRPEPKERYASAFALADDVRRHLAGAPVVARGDTTRYLLKSALRRHRLAVVASVVVVMSLVAGLVGTLWQARVAREHARKAEEAEAFLIDMVRAFDPEKGDGRPLTQRDILERGEARLGEALADQPLEQARLLRVFAETWMDLGDANDRALACAERALALQRSVLGPRDGEVAKTLAVLGDVYERRSELPQAERANTEALSIALGAEGPLGPTVALVTSHLGTLDCRRSEFAEGQRLLRQAVEISRSVRGDEAVETLDRWSDLAVCLDDQGLDEESAAINRRIVATSVKVRGATHPATLLIRHNLAANLLALGQFREAEAILREVLELQHQVLGPERTLGGTKRMLGLALDGEGRAEEALALFDEGVRAYAAAEGPEGYMVGLCLLSRSQALRHLGRPAEAEAAAREALRMHLAHQGEDRFTARMRVAIGAALVDQGRPGDARELLAGAVAYLDARVPLHRRAREAHAELARAEAALAKPAPSASP
jgi:eukaryotic-like serine/threonine-protein kinase